jgi:hypothetical protein
MMEKDIAIAIQELALEAVHALAKAGEICASGCSGEERRQIERGVGLSMGRIETELLGVIYAAYPELDDLKDVPNLRGLIHE